MRIFRFANALLCAVLLAGSLRAQTVPYLAGGAIYNVREDDTGFWVESGLQRGRVAGGIGASDMLTDNYRYRELEGVGRFFVVQHFAVEGGFGLGLSCRFAVPSTCDHEHAKWYAPFGGVAYYQPLSQHFRGVFRLDVTPAQLSGRPFTHGKDDGLRLRFGVVITP
jgi:hypothetical protein